MLRNFEKRLLFLLLVVLSIVLLETIKSWAQNTASENKTFVDSTSSSTNRIAEETKVSGKAVSFSVNEIASIKRDTDSRPDAQTANKSAPADPTDFVSLKNGDRITGKVTGADGKTMSVQTDYAGEVKIDW